MEIVDVNTLFGPLTTSSTDLSVDELAGLMREHSVRNCCTLSTIGVMLDPMVGNAATRAACSENASLLPVATINPQGYFGGAGPHTRLRADGFKMVRFFPGAQGWEPDYAPFHALLDDLAAEHLPVMVEVDRPGTSTHLVRAAGAYPGPLILAGVDVQTLAEAVALMRSHPNLHVETSRLLAMGAVRHGAEQVGAGRFLYGSGAPLRPMASGLAALCFSGLLEGERAMVLGQNARELLAL